MALHMINMLRSIISKCNCFFYFDSLIDFCGLPVNTVRFGMHQSIPNLRVDQHSPEKLEITFSQYEEK